MYCSCRMPLIAIRIGGRYSATLRKGAKVSSNFKLKKKKTVYGSNYSN